jgi:hypothetical protein
MQEASALSGWVGIAAVRFAQAEADEVDQHESVCRLP